MKKLFALGLLAMVASTLSVTATVATTQTKHEVIVKPDVQPTAFTITATSVDAIVFVAETKASVYSVNTFEFMPVVTNLKPIAVFDVGWRSRFILANNSKLNTTNHWLNHLTAYNRCDTGLFKRRLMNKYRC